MDTPKMVELKLEESGLREDIEADEAAIRVEDEVPGSFRGSKYVGEMTRIDHRDELKERLASVEADIQSERLPHR